MISHDDPEEQRLRALDEERTYLQQAESARQRTGSLLFRALQRQRAALARAEEAISEEHAYVTRLACRLQKQSLLLRRLQRNLLTASALLAIYGFAVFACMLMVLQTIQEHLR